VFFSHHGTVADVDMFRDRDTQELLRYEHNQQRHRSQYDSRAHRGPWHVNNGREVRSRVEGAVVVVFRWLLTKFSHRRLSPV